MHSATTGFGNVRQGLESGQSAQTWLDRTPTHRRLRLDKGAGGMDHAVRLGAISRRGALALGLGALGASAARAWTTQPTGDWAAVDRIANGGIAAGKSPALQISVMLAGQLAYSKAFGLANLETRTPALPASIFRIGSLTKQFTAAAILLLAQDGRLSVDDPLSRFIADFPRASGITLRMLLNHTSGLGNYTDTASRRDFLQASRPDYDEAALLAAMRATNPLFALEPGMGWAYSNTGYVLLGIVIARVSAMPFGRFMRERLFVPHGLSRTAVDDAAEMVPARASGYTPGSAGAAAFDNASFISMTYPGAAGAMRSTADDLCRWHDALLQGRVLNPASLSAMIEPARLRNGELPTMPGPNAEIPRIPVQYGMGIGLGRTRGRRWLAHAGGIQGFQSSIRTYPAERLTIATLVNSDDESDNGPAAWTSELRAAAEQIVFAV